jgi:hypothetical protein
LIFALALFRFGGVRITESKMNVDATNTDQADEDIFTYAVSDEAAGRGGRIGTHIRYSAVFLASADRRPTPASGSGPPGAGWF